jgi:hypothetical protein
MFETIVFFWIVLSPAAAFLFGRFVAIGERE